MRSHLAKVGFLKDHGTKFMDFSDIGKCLKYACISGIFLGLNLKLFYALVYAMARAGQ